MALIWADGFEHWGSKPQMVTGGYIMSDFLTLVTNNPQYARTGKAYIQGRAEWRRAYDPMLVCTFGIAMRTDQFDTDDRFPPGYTMIDKDGRGVTIVFYNDGSFGAMRADNNDVLLWRSGTAKYKAGTWNYLEMQINVPAQTWELHVNNVFLGSGQLAGIGNTGIVMFRYDRVRVDQGANARETAHADYYVTTSDIAGPNPGFLGDVRCRTVYPTDNGPDQAWSVTGADNAVAAINQVPFNQNRFIAAANVGDVSNFEVGNLPDNTSYVAGLNVFMATGKSDAGICEVTPEIQSGGVTSDLMPITPGVAPAYYSRISETDPATGVYWTKAAVNAVRVGMKRTA